GKPRNFTRAAFAEDDGHLLHYVRRVTGTSQRLEITVDQFERREAQPLRAADVAEARSLWRKKGLRDHQLAYVLRQGGAAGRNFLVKVVDGALLTVRIDGELAGSRHEHGYDVPGLLALAEARLRQVEGPDSGVSEALFDPSTGQPRWFRWHAGEARQLELII